MNKHQCFAAWAPDNSLWSPWVKPVLFACMDLSGEIQNTLTINASSENWTAPAPSERTAVFLDLPGPDAISIALACAAKGYRPVPVYNALPTQGVPGTGSPTNEVVAVRPILDALKAAAPHLAQLQIPADAPPLFLLDANRRVGVKPAGDGWFDNRSVSLSTDFPSANFLLSNGISRVLLVTSSWPSPQEDLAHTLRRYQQAGIEILSQPLASPDPAKPIHVAAPAWYRCAFQRFLAVVGLRRNPLGGFGGMLPDPSSGG
jgi:hypothetical protein